MANKVGIIIQRILNVEHDSNNSDVAVHVEICQAVARFAVISDKVTLSAWTVNNKKYCHCMFLLM